MIIIRTADQLERLLASNLEPSLQAILQDHRDRLTEYADFAFEELAAIFVFQPGDQPDALNEASGIAILQDPPCWEHLVHQDGWYELVFVISDDGFGWIVLIPDWQDTDHRLLALCERHTANT